MIIIINTNVIAMLNVNIAMISLKISSYLRTYTFLCHHNHHPAHLRLVITTATIINMVVISQSAPFKDPPPASLLS